MSEIFSKKFIDIMVKGMKNVVIKGFTYGAKTPNKNLVPYGQDILPVFGPEQYLEL